MKIRALTPADVTVEVICHPEEVSVRGYLMASDDDEADREAEDTVLAQLEAGNDWAWCSVEVRVEWKGYTASDYLGCCSYASREDFEVDGYFTDMRDAAIESLNETLAGLAVELSTLEVTP